jgi:hypothetical protein
MLTPPAGAIGRGDGFILRIAEKSGALVLSNDSFQEFHAERPWLFDEGRLIGGKPVPGVGWVFTPRTPVRGPKSRSVTGKSRRDAKAAAAANGADELPAGVEVEAPKGTKGAKAGKSAKAGTTTKAGTSTKAAKASKAPKSGESSKPGKADKSAKSTAKTAKGSKAAEPAKASKAAKAGKTAKAAKAAKTTKTAKSTATGETSKVTTPAKASKRANQSAKAGKGGAGTDSRSQGKSTKATHSATGSQPSADGQAGQALNEPMAFITFVADHPIGSRFDGTVVGFTSHGAHVDVGDMRAHIPLAGLGNPPPNKARDLLTKGETRQFELVSLDAARRRAALKLPGVKS